MKSNIIVEICLIIIYITCMIISTYLMINNHDNCMATNGIIQTKQNDSLSILYIDNQYRYHNKVNNCNYKLTNTNETYIIGESINICVFNNHKCVNANNYKSFDKIILLISVLLLLFPNFILLCYVHNKKKEQHLNNKYSIIKIFGIENEIIETTNPIY